MSTYKGSKDSDFFPLQKHVLKTIFICSLHFLNGIFARYIFSASGGK